jgi:hypothetical protein
MGNINKVDLRERGREDGDRINWLRMGSSGGLSEDADGGSDSIKISWVIESR